MHTPGPWASGRAIPEDGAVSRIVRAGDDHIAVVMHLEDAAQEAADNARLIAAAPELLAESQRLLARLQEMSIHPSHYAGIASAIASATGGQ